MSLTFMFRWRLPGKVALMRCCRFLAAALMIAVVGAGTLLGRFADPDPLQYRREIFQSSVEMIATRPWAGYGLGTFATVYPEFAEFDADFWDQQLEQDITAGRLDKLADEALGDLREGQCTDL